MHPDLPAAIGGRSQLMTLPLVELVFFDGCPYVDVARVRIRSALDAISNIAVYREWSDDDPAAPGYVRGLPSPTVLVDGRDRVVS